MTQGVSATDRGQGTGNPSLGGSPSPGCAVLVVGPSGVGKDTLLDGAREIMGECGCFVFPRRVITRSPEAGGEAHISVSTREFEALERDGQFCLSWGAHGLHYGLPVALESHLAAGRHVLMNASRGVIGTARTRFARVRVLSITAAPATLARRLSLRGRESAAEIEARLHREAGKILSGEDITEISNDGRVEDALARFLAALAAIDPECTCLQRRRPAPPGSQGHGA